MIQPRVLDLSHHNTVTDLNATSQGGVWGVIHKATQGVGFRDSKYPARRAMANDAGLLWGAYHFGDNGDVLTQVSSFLAYAQPDSNTLLCLDYEDHPNGPSKTMQPSQMVQFLRAVESRTGRKATLYSGNRIKETIASLSAADRAYVTSHKLWLCEYGPQPKLPKGYTRSFLWQFTDGHDGPEPHGFPGIQDGADLSAYNGTRDQLTAEWGAAPAAIACGPIPVRGSDDAGTTLPLPPFLQPTGGLNVQPIHAQYSVEVEVLQRELDAMGYHEMGEFDGYWGGKTASAVKAFFVDRGINEIAQPGPVLNNAIGLAKADHNADGSPWTRPISPHRANATPKEIAHKVESVRVSLWGQFIAKIAAGFAAVGVTGSTISGAFQSAQDAFAPIHNLFAKIPPEVWFLLMGFVACSVWYVTNRAAQASTKDYNTGRLS